MKKLVSLMAITVAVMLVALPLAYAQGQPRPQGPKTFEGQLTNVDAKAQTISVKGSAGEMMFKYTEQTQVAGGEKDVQGLATKSGATVIVTYQDAGGDNHIAAKIEVVPAKK
jgi:hypothetical protein